MLTTTHNDTFSLKNPMLLIEDIFIQREWSYERQSEDELIGDMTGRWCDYRLYFLWRPDLECLMVSCIMDMKVSTEKQPVVAELLSLMNAAMWLGHFELTADEPFPTYRYNLLVCGTSGVATEQLETILDTIVSECDRFYPALQFVLWGGKSPQEAVAASILETVGEA